MSWIKPLLNLHLRLLEKPYLNWEENPQRLAWSFENKAKLFFHPPEGSHFETCTLACDAKELDAIRVNANNTRAGPLILYFHGGAYIFGSPETHQAMVACLADDVNLSACLPSYSLATHAPFPAAVDDALCAYRAVMAHPGGVILGGDSAGGGLALSLLAEILRLKLTKPLGLFAFSPFTDLSFSGASIGENAELDVLLPIDRVQDVADLYLDGADPLNPMASPLFADFAGAPPIWLTAADTEILLDDTRRISQKLRAEGVEVTEVIEHDLPHVWPLFHNILPEGKQTLQKLAIWINSLSSPTDDN